MKTTIDKAGRVVIPRAIRQAAGFKPGQKIDVTYKDGNVVIELEDVPKRAEKRGHFWVIVPDAPMPPLTQDEVNTVIEADRNRYSEEKE